MDRKYVSSSNLRSVGYDAENRILEVEFLDLSVYQYYAVSAAVHHGLMYSASKGQYFDAFIKNIYRWRRVR